MAKDATEVYSGPVTTFEISSNGADWTDLGIVGGTATITFTPTPAETSDKKQIDTRGLGVLEAELLQTGSTIQSALSGVERTLLLARFTTADGKVYTLQEYTYISVTLTRENEGTHTFMIHMQAEVPNMDDWISFPTDA